MLNLSQSTRAKIYREPNKRHVTLVLWIFRGLWAFSTIRAAISRRLSITLWRHLLAIIKEVKTKTNTNQISQYCLTFNKIWTVLRSSNTCPSKSSTLTTNILPIRPWVIDLFPTLTPRFQSIKQLSKWGIFLRPQANICSRFTRKICLIYMGEKLWSRRFNRWTCHLWQQSCQKFRSKLLSKLTRARAKWIIIQAMRAPRVWRRSDNKQITLRWGLPIFTRRLGGRLASTPWSRVWLRASNRMGLWIEQTWRFNNNNNNYKALVKGTRIFLGVVRGVQARSYLWRLATKLIQMHQPRKAIID